MGLRDIVVRRIKVPVDETQSFEVRGLSAADLVTLVNQHGAEMALIYGKIKGSAGAGKVTPEMVRQAITALSTEAPGLLAMGIALASDDTSPEAVRVAATLPATVQAAALIAVFQLSMSSESEVKKVVESLSEGLAKVAATLSIGTIPSLDGIGTSAAASAS